MTDRDWRPGTPGRYYMRRPRKDAQFGFGEDYWRGIKDPDGNIRDRTKERNQHIADLSQEIQYVNDLPPGRILDVGCGLGFLLSGVNDEWEKHGVEVSEFAVEKARQWADVKLGSLETAEFPSAHFDVVMCHHVVEHIESPEELLDEIRRVLRPGGILILGTPDFDGGCARLFGPNYRLLHDPTHISLFTNESAHRLVRDRGFIVERVECPYFETRHFTMENLERLFDRDQTSPPFYGNFLTLYCWKPHAGALTLFLQRIGSFAPAEMRDVDERAAAAVELAACAIQGGGCLWIAGDDELLQMVSCWQECGALRFSEFGGRTGVPFRIADSNTQLAKDDLLIGVNSDNKRLEFSTGIPERALVISPEECLRSDVRALGVISLPVQPGLTWQSIQIVLLSGFLQEVHRLLRIDID